MLIDPRLDEYRPNVGVALFNRSGDVFLGRRIVERNDPEKFMDDHRWQLPQGGIDAGEDVARAAFRELREETGVSSATLIALTPGWLAYDFPENYARGKWRGQRQRWAAMVFTGEDSEIDLQADDHQEFDDWRWGNLDEAPDLVVPFKRGVYTELATAFAPLRAFLRTQHD